MPRNADGTHYLVTLYHDRYAFNVMIQPGGMTPNKDLGVTQGECQRAKVNLTLPLQPPVLALPHLAMLRGHTDAPS